MRQRRSKTERQDEPGPEYEHAPRDAAGDVVFLILPDGVRKSYDERMKRCAAIWRATGDPLVIAEAHTLTMLHRQVSPLWLDEAIYQLAKNRRTPAQAKRAREAMIRFMRYKVVRDAQRNGMTWEASYAEAERVWASNPEVAAAADTMRKDYAQVKRDIDEGRGGQYFMAHEQDREDLKGWGQPGWNDPDQVEARAEAWKARHKPE